MLRLTYDGTVSSFRKNDQYPCYINVRSYHPKVFKQISYSIMIRLLTNSSNEDIFTYNKVDYEIALKIVDLWDTHFFSLKISNKNILKNILEI